MEDFFTSSHVAFYQANHLMLLSSDPCYSTPGVKQCYWQPQLKTTERATKRPFLLFIYRFLKKFPDQNWKQSFCRFNSLSISLLLLLSFIFLHVQQNVCCLSLCMSPYKVSTHWTHVWLYGNVIWDWDMRPSIVIKVISYVQLCRYLCVLSESTYFLEGSSWTSTSSVF